MGVFVGQENLRGDRTLEAVDRHQACFEKRCFNLNSLVTVVPVSGAMRRSFRPPADFLALVVCMTAIPAVAIGQQRLNLDGPPSAQARNAFPVARCVWQSRYRDARDLTKKMAVGIKKSELQLAINDLTSSCPRQLWQGLNAGQVASALVYTEGQAISACVSAKNRDQYDRLVLSVRKISSIAAQEFLKKGFPVELYDAVKVCDANLLVKDAESARARFGESAFGWKDPYILDRPTSLGTCAKLYLKSGFCVEKR